MSKSVMKVWKKIKGIISISAINFVQGISYKIWIKILDYGLLFPLEQA